MCRTDPHLALLAQLLLVTALPGSAHNGAVAILVPVEAITVDGDLSDWPEGLGRYPIASSPAGAVADARCLGCWLQVACSGARDALYIAPKVADDTAAVDACGKGTWRQDGCGVGVDLDDDSIPF